MCCGSRCRLWANIPKPMIVSRACSSTRTVTQPWYVLDPRFPEVRQYLIDLYRSFITDYDMDGFKLDFIDSFQFRMKRCFHWAKGVISIRLLKRGPLVDRCYRSPARTQAGCADRVPSTLHRSSDA